MPLTEYIARYKLWDLCMIPIIPKRKDPAIKWEQFQKRKPDEAELINWFTENEHNIAVVCGGISGNLVVLDFDDQELYAAFSNYWQEFYGMSIRDMTPIVQTGGGGYHVYLKAKQKPPLYHPVGDERRHIPDIQSEGGYVLAPPSIHPNSKPYKFLNPNVMTIHEVKSLSELAIDIPTRSSAPKSSEEPIGKGSRNATLAKMGGAMRRQGMPQSAIEVALLEVNATQCQPPLAVDEVAKIVKSMARYSPITNVPSMGWGGEEGGGEGYDSQAFGVIARKRDRNATESATTTATKPQQEPLSKVIEDWVASTSGWFDTPELDRELALISTAHKNNRREIMLRLEAKGILERHPKVNKQFRYVDPSITNLAFKTATNAGILPLRWPLGIEKYVNIFPGNMVVVAGSPNAGKTALLLNFIRKNQDNFEIRYYCSEMGAVELRDRLDKFSDMGIEDWKFEAIERAGDFADVLRPDCINIIDYLEMTTELFAINTHLTAISHKLGTGVALVALQKKMGAVFGRGQEFGMEKPKLYLSMDKGKLQIVKGKSWAKANVDPNGLKISFKIIDGCQFQVAGEWTW